MWPILLQFLRSNAPYLTLPFAAVIGVVGYNLEGYFSDRYTPYNTNFIVEPRERTFIAIQPDGIQQGIVGTVIERFERKGLKLIALKLAQSKELQKNYDSESPDPDSPGVVVQMVWQGPNAVKIVSKMLGADSQPGTLRGDLCNDKCNIIYGSNSVESAKREIGLWFSEKELVEWKPAIQEWVYE